VDIPILPIDFHARFWHLRAHLDRERFNHDDLGRSVVKFGFDSIPADLLEHRLISCFSGGPVLLATRKIERVCEDKFVILFGRNPNRDGSIRIVVVFDSKLLFVFYIDVTPQLDPTSNNSDTKQE